MPTLTLFVGTNGVGKSTIYDYLNSKKRDFGKRINADDILKQNGGNWRNTKDVVKSGMDAVKEIKKCLESRISFNWEMTLITSFTLKQLQIAKSLGYTINLYFISVENEDIALCRVVKRQVNGGHGVPLSLVKERFSRQFDNIASALPNVDYALFFDNSRIPHIVGEYKNKQLTIMDPKYKLATKLQEISKEKTC